MSTTDRRPSLQLRSLGRPCLDVRSCVAVASDDRPSTDRVRGWQTCTWHTVAIAGMSGASDDMALSPSEQQQAGDRPAGDALGPVELYCFETSGWCGRRRARAWLVQLCVCVLERESVCADAMGRIGSRGRSMNCQPSALVCMQVRAPRHPLRARARCDKPRHRHKPNQRAARCGGSDALDPPGAAQGARAGADLATH